MRAQARSRTPDLMATLGVRSNVVRRDRAAMRARLGAGELRLSRVLRDREEWALDVQIIDLLLWQRRFGPEKLRALNRRAVAAGVNLAQRLGRASDRTLAWLARELEGAGR
jgi:hypothetical protein